MPQIVLLDVINGACHLNTLFDRLPKPLLLDLSLLHKVIRFSDVLVVKIVWLHDSLIKLRVPKGEQLVLVFGIRVSTNEYGRAILLLRHFLS